ncbi:MAG: UvrD-helicase domain-containing protein, partial [Planctomycetota bacterium]|nr:UvrD-helicase domain-containing protein [Planctomycetota bacterium]
RYGAFGQTAYAIAALRASIAAGMADACQRRKDRQRQKTYDDLIRETLKALRDPGCGKRLAAALRQDYDAVFVDEFQDTDPAQYEIFREVFLASPRPRVYLVGDPKQAIYAFRQGDVYAYFSAAADKKIKRQALEVNYRSERKLVEAINKIFGNAFGASEADAEIAYPAKLQAKDKAERETLREQSEGRNQFTPDPHPFHIWYYQNDETRLGSSSQEYQNIYSDVADEVHRLLYAQKVKIGERWLQPRDIAILVMKHHEAEAIYHCLRARHIPAVRQRTGNIFASDEAADMQFLLAALLAPADASSLAAALATDIFPLADSDWLRLREGETVAFFGGQCDLSQCSRHFFSAREEWERHSLFAAFRYLDEHFGLLPHLLALENGERRATNVLQLVEMIDRAAAEAQLAPLGAVNWLAQQRAQADEENETAEIRLENDEAAVQILTVFKSKGLEFPIVFIPTLAVYKSRGDNIPYIYHTPAQGQHPKWEVVVDFTGEGEEKSRREQAAEHMRLFYVAATRAINRVYLIWGRKFGPWPDESALAVTRALKKLNIFAAPAPASSSAKNPRRKADTAAGRPKKKSDESWPEVAPLDDLATAPLKIEIRSLTREATAPAAKSCLPPSASEPTSLQTWQARTGRRLTVNTSCRHTSYSDLSPFAVRAQESRDYDAIEEEADEIDDSIFGFPAGSRIGLCWHEILRRLDYAALAPEADPAQRAAAEALIDDLLRQYGLLPPADAGRAQLRRQAALAMFQRAVTAPLDLDPPLALCRLSPAAQRREFGFDFALRRWSESEKAAGGRKIRLRAILARYWCHDPHRRFLEGLAEDEMAVPQGLLCGYIDLVFCHGGRYYLLDWKSNRCGGALENFAAENLWQEIANQGYWLQYLIYALALHQHVRTALPR